MHKIDIDKIQSINTIEDAEAYLFSVISPSPLIEQALEYSKESHKHQVRKSGEPYVVHPILVGAIVATITEDTSMVIAALLHDVIEDTHVSVDDVSEHYGKDVAHLVDNPLFHIFTKIVHPAQPLCEAARLTGTAKLEKIFCIEMIATA